MFTKPCSVHITRLLFVTIISSSSIICQELNTVGKPTTIPAKSLPGIPAYGFKGSADAVAHSFLETRLNKIGLTSMDCIRHIETIESLSDYHICYQQFYQGIPVHNAHINISVNKNNKVYYGVESIHMEVTNLSTTPSVSSQQALNCMFHDIEGATEDDSREVQTELSIVYDADTIPTLAWKITYYSLQKRAVMRTFVRCDNGSVISVEKISLNYEPGTGLVFQPDPITVLKNDSLLDQNDANYYPISTTYKQVTLNDLNDATDSGYVIQGRYASSQEKRDPKVALAKSDSPNAFLYDRSDKRFEEVNIYYYIDLQRRYFGSLGFEPKFGPPSNKTDYLVFDAHGMGGSDQWGAGYNTFTDSTAFIEFGDGMVDAGEDPDVILHEYTHAIHDALMPGNDVAGADQDEISEGSADYFAVSYRHNLYHPIYQPGRFAPWNWNRDVPLGFPFGPPRYVIEQQNGPYITYPDNWSGSGTVWARALMDLEINSIYGIGKNITATLLLKSFSMVTLATYAPLHVFALMSASRELYDSKQLLSLGWIFYDRGFFKERSGSHGSHLLSGNQITNATWDELRWVENDVTLSSNITVSIDSSAFVYIGNEQSIIVETGATLRLNGESRIIIYNNASIMVKSGGSLLIEDEAAIILHGGTIICEGNGQVILENSRAIRGSGYISSANLTWIRGMNLLEGESIIFQNGGVFNFDCTQANRPQYIINSGNITFEGSANEYVFGSCLDEIRIYASGTFVTEAGVTLQNLPTLISWDYAVLQSNGTQQDPCAWLFRSGAGLEDYTSLLATRTTFGGRTMLGTPTEEWNGILVGDVSSWIDLDYCTVQDVYADLANSGTGIHFYQSGVQYISRIKNSRILRNNSGQNKYGDGIFLQPGNTFSYVKMECSEINQDWYTGFTSVGSYPRIFDSKIMSNLVGVGLSASSILTMQRSCVEGHVYEGIDIDASELSFASQGTAGGNRIVDNANQQMDVNNGSVVYGGWSPAGGSIFEGHDNNISSTSQAWVANVNGSTAYLQKNWFGVVPGNYDPVTGFCYLTPTQAGSLFNGATIHYDPAHCSEILPYCTTDCLEFSQNPGGVASFSTPASLPPFASGLLQLRAYARAGNFAEVYRFMSTLIPNSVSGPIAKRYASLLMHLENEHVRNNPDTLAVSRSRLNAFLLARFSTSNQSEAKAAILNVLARSLFALEDISGADYRISQLRNQYPNSPYALDILPVLQLVAMAQRDSVKMNNAISLMQSGNFPSEEMRLARTMKRAYHRFRPQSPYPKSVFYHVDHEALPQTAALEVRNYPNPFNPSTVLEYALPESGQTTLLVYDLLGREVAKLVDEEQVAGVHSAVFDAGNYPSGIYMYVLTTPSGQITGKMLLAR